MRRVEKCNRRLFYGCVIEIDLLNFYDNINKTLLFNKILRVCETQNEKNAALLLNQMLHKFSDKDGIPQNSDASSLLASFYLNQVDVFMNHHAQAYYRFMDDIRIFCKNKYEARKILQTFEFELRRCHLSVNSQKTKIRNLTDAVRSEYTELFDLSLNQITRLRKSGNYSYRSDAFHKCIDLLEVELATEDTNDSDESARRLNYALNTIALLGVRNISLVRASDFRGLVLMAAENLKDKPWITTQVCKILNLLDREVIKTDFLEYLKPIVLEANYNTYSFQTYQIWLLLAKHKCDSIDLKEYAVKQIEKNDDTNKAVIAAMVIYMCSVDKDYRRVLLRKYGEGFVHGYFQNRIALISLRTFSPDFISSDSIHGTLKYAHEFTHKYKDKDLVFVLGGEEDEDSESFEQLYSI